MLVGRWNRMILLLVILAVLFSVCAFHFPVSAITPELPSYTMEELDVYINEHGEEYYAYMILDEADESLRPIILEARWRIISNSTWVADDLYGHIEDEAGNIIEIVPHFHEIFPADWEIETGRELY